MIWVSCHDFSHFYPGICRDIFSNATEPSIDIDSKSDDSGTHLDCYWHTILVCTLCDSDRTAIKVWILRRSSECLSRRRVWQFVMKRLAEIREIPFIVLDINSCKTDHFLSVTCNTVSFVVKHTTSYLRRLAGSCCVCANNSFHFRNHRNPYTYYVGRLMLLFDVKEMYYV